MITWRHSSIAWLTGDLVNFSLRGKSAPKLTIIHTITTTFLEEFNVKTVHGKNQYFIVILAKIKRLFARKPMPIKSKLLQVTIQIKSCTRFSHSNESYCAIFCCGAVFTLHKVYFAFEKLGKIVTCNYFAGRTIELKGVDPNALSFSSKGQTIRVLRVGGGGGGDFPDIFTKRELWLAGYFLFNHTPTQKSPGSPPSKV